VIKQVEAIQAKAKELQQPHGQARFNALVGRSTYVSFRTTLLTKVVMVS
jgi:hypothetical protein